MGRRASSLRLSLQSYIGPRPIFSSSNGHTFVPLPCLVGELGLVNLTTRSCCCITARLLAGSRSTLLAHFHVPIVPKLLSSCLPALAAPCPAIHKCQPPATKVSFQNIRPSRHPMTRSYIAKHSVTRWITGYSTRRHNAHCIQYTIIANSSVSMHIMQYKVLDRDALMRLPLQ